MRIVFRADASVQIGTGHVMRCLTLAEELRRQGHQCAFICRDHKGHLADLIAQKGFELHLLAMPEQTDKLVKNQQAPAYTDWLGVPWQADAEQTRQILLQHKVDWLVVDHYALDAHWERQTAQAVCQITVIDDLADREHDCAVLLDQNLGRAVSDYYQRVPLSCKKLIGPQYSLLRPEFAEFRPASLERRRTSELKRILISLGGVDRTNVTGQVLDAFSNITLPSDTELDIIMGTAAPYLDAVKQQAFDLPFQATVNVSVSDMAERMCRADLAIGSAGGTAWERCCLGLPSVLIVVAENQISGSDALVRAGAALTPERDKPLSLALTMVLERLSTRTNLSRITGAAESVTDGNGAPRVCWVLQEIAKGGYE